MFYGWYIVGSSLLINLYISGVVSLGFTAVIQPISNEFGWSYAKISLASSLRGLEMGLLAPVVGLIVDRIGPRKLMFSGCIIIFLGFLLLSYAPSLVMFYASFILLAIGQSLCTGTVPMTAVNKWFRKKAGLAVGILACGVALGGLMVPIVTRLTDTFDWRKAMLIVGFGMLVVGLPLSLLIRHKPEQYGYRPDGLANGISKTKEQQPEIVNIEVNFSAKQALKTRTFWLVAIASACNAFVVTAVVTHIMPYLSSLGIDRSVSSMAALAVPAASLTGRLGSIWLGEKYGRKLVFVFGFVALTTGMLLFGNITAGRIWLLVPCVLTFGFGWGCNVTTRIMLQRESFGTTNLGAIFGFTEGIQMVGQMTGAPLAGWVFDTWGSYQGAWFGFLSVTLAGMILGFALPKHGDKPGVTGLQKI